MPPTTAKRVPRKETDLPSSISSMEIPDGATDTTFTDSYTGPTVADVAPEPPKSKAETEVILKALQGTYVTLASIVSFVSMPDGVIIARNTEELTESWRMLLDNDPKLRKTMKRLIEGSGWGTVISAHMVVAIAIAGNHRDKFSHLYKRRQNTSTDE